MPKHILFVYSLFTPRAVGLSWQVSFTRADVAASSGFVPLSYHSASYKGKGALYFFCECYVDYIVLDLITLFSQTTSATLVTRL